MKTSPTPGTRVRFATFEADLDSGELRRKGLKVKIQEMPFQVLVLLLERPGEVVTREDLRKRLWPSDTFVDFEQGLNKAINKVREALDDDANNPRFVETLPRRGYRFIYPLTEASFSPGETAATNGPGSTGAVQASRWEAWAFRRKMVALAGTVIVLIAAAVVGLNVAGLRNRILGRVDGPPIIHSIAVLPLENLSGDPSQEYFAEGMTEELITDLGKISALRVISRTSVMRYKGTKKPLPEIARELNVDAIVEGTFERAGNRVRITANLLYAPEDRHLWAESYERDMHDVLALQDEVARAIASQIRVKLTPKEHARLASGRPVNSRAQEAYLRGRFYLNKPTRGDLLKAIDYGKQAVEIDPGYAPAYGLLASCYWESSETGGFGILLNWKAAEKTRAAATKALAIDDTLAEAHVGLASVLDRNDWDWAGAEREFKRAIELNPNFGRAHAMYAWHLAMVGRPGASIREAKRAVDLDPFSAQTVWTLARMYYAARQYDQTIEQTRNLNEMLPNFGTHFLLGSAFQMQGKYGRAVAEMRKVWEHRGAKADEIAAFDRAYKIGGIKGVWRWEITKFKQRAARKNAGLVDAAGAYALLGEKDQAIESLDRAYQRHIQGLALVQCTPELDSLHSDPRFQDLVRRMHFPPESGNTKPTP